MNRTNLLALALLFSATTATLSCADGAAIELFDGKTLTGWDGDAKFWRVEDGLLTGESTAEVKLPHNSFAIWTGGTVANFDIEFDYRIMSDWANSGLQYRSTAYPDHVVGGYQADIESGTTYTGINYGEKTGREILAQRGERVWLGDGKTKNKVEKFADGKELQAFVKGKGEWNHYHVLAVGNKMTHEVNGHLMSETIDESAKDAKSEGILALQMHAGQPMKIQFKDIRLKQLPKSAP